jgi:hypothetical protein
MSDEKLFTQAELNDIIGERIGRLKEKYRTVKINRDVTDELRKEIDTLRHTVEELKHIVQEMKGE